MQPQDLSACPGMPTVLAHPLPDSARQPDGQEVGRRTNMSCVWRALFPSSISKEGHNPVSWDAAAATVRKQKVRVSISGMGCQLSRLLTFHQ